MKHRSFLILIFVVLFASAALAQDPDDLPEDWGAESPATLSLSFDRQGGVDINFNVAQNSIDVDAITDVLARFLHCASRDFHHPEEPGLTAYEQKNWSAARRERYRKQLADFNRRQIIGHCQGSLTQNEEVWKGDFDWSSLATRLHQIGADELNLTVLFPKTEYREYPQQNLIRGPFQTSTGLYYRIALAENTRISVFHLAYGFRRSDLNRAFAILLGFILLPLLITLAMRRRALALAKTDPAAAWFGFIRTLNWMVLGAMLVWITSGLGARPLLEEWIAMQGFSALKAASASVALTVLPAFLVYLFCISLSYPVHSKLRATQWTRGEFLLQQLATVAAQAMPLILGLAGIQILGKQPEIAAALLIFAVLLLQLLQTLKLRVMKAFPQPLMTGELRDRIFALASRLGVAVNQIFVLPAGKGQVANAFAAKNRIVMFTDYLLDHLNKQEVDGIAAHELAHLRFKHPAKIGMAFLAAIFLPQYFVWLMQLLVGLLAIPIQLIPSNMARASIVTDLYIALFRFEAWSQKDLLLLFLGMTGFYFLSRHFEYVADATAVRLTGNAEAQITGLLKVSRLNLIPIRWGKASESWLTHPSTVRRVHRMAAAGGLARERVQQILSDYDLQGSGTRIVPPGDRYSVPPAADPERLRTALQDRSRTQGKLWLNLAAYVLPPAAVALSIRTLHLAGWSAFSAYIAGIIATAFLVVLAGVLLGESGKERRKIRLRERFGLEHVPAGIDGDVFVGFAPGPYPRIYGTRYHYDTGFLVLSKGRLQFVGEQVKFSFSPSEIDSVVIGRGGPSWWRFERVYVRWKTEDGRNGIFNLNTLEPGSVWSTRARVRALCLQIQQWQVQAAQYPEARPELAYIKTLELGQVTSLSPSILGKANVNMKVSLWVLLLAIGISMLTHADLWYMCLSVVILRMIHSVPYWRYRDEMPPFQAAVEGEFKSRSATAAVGHP